MATYKPTYDTFATQREAITEAMRRNRHAKANGSGRTFVIRKQGVKSGRNTKPWTVMYREDQ